MKKNLIYILFLCCGLLSSCNNDEIISNDNVNMEQMNFISDEVYYIESELDMLKLLEGEAVKIIDSDFEKTDNIATRSSGLKQAKGFTRYRSLGNYKAGFSAELASRLGLQYGVIYVAETRRYIKDVKPAGVFIPARLIAGVGNSPQCGILPHANEFGDFGITNWDLRGYIEGTVTTSTYSLESAVFYINCTISGGKVNKFYPKHPDNLLWDYYDL